jgi:hypothetical protein
MSLEINPGYNFSKGTQTLKKKIAGIKQSKFKRCKKLQTFTS